MAVDLAVPGQQLQRADGDRLQRDADDDEFAAAAQAVDGGGHRVGVGDGGQDHLGAAERLEGFGDAPGGAVDVVVRAELVRQGFLLRAAGDGDRTEAHGVGELDAQVAEAAHAEDRDGVARAGGGMAQGVEDGDAGAGQRRGLGIGQFVGHGRECVGGHDDGVGVAARVGGAGDLQLGAVDGVAVAAGLAVSAAAAEPAHRDPVADLPALDAVAEGVDAAGDLVTGGDRESGAGQQAGADQQVGVADAARHDGDADRAGAGLAQRHFDQFERRVGGGELNGAHGVGGGGDGRGGGGGGSHGGFLCQGLSAGWGPHLPAPPLRYVHHRSATLPVR